MWDRDLSSRRMFRLMPLQSHVVGRPKKPDGQMTSGRKNRLKSLQENKESPSGI